MTRSDPMIDFHSSPLGRITFSSDGTALTGLWFDGRRHADTRTKRDLPIFSRTKEWLDCYFAGEEPKFTPPISMKGTSFQIAVWNILTKIPYGETVTYGEIALLLAERRGVTYARAVGGAVGRNPISIIVPCHRVLGVGGKLTGYSGGIDRKIALLKIENANLSSYQFFKESG